MADFITELQKGKLTEDNIRKFLNYMGIEGEEFEAKTLQNKKQCCLETWSVIEGKVEGWFWNLKPNMFYLWGNKTGIYGLKGIALEAWRNSHVKTGDLIIAKCPKKNCQKEFSIPKILVDGLTAYQTIQETPDRKYHSSAFRVSVDKLPMIIKAPKYSQLSLFW